MTLFHAQSWLLTHYLLQGRPELRISIPRYLKALRQGPVELDALESIFGVGVEQLESDLRSYVERGVFRNSTIDFAVPQATLANLRAAAAGRQPERLAHSAGRAAGAAHPELVGGTHPPGGATLSYCRR